MLGILGNCSVHFNFLRFSGTWLTKELTFLSGMKTTSTGGKCVTFKSIFAFCDTLEQDFKKVDISTWDENCITWLILYKFQNHFCFVKHSKKLLKKELTFLLGMKTTSRGGTYLIFKSLFAISDSLENDLKNCSNLCLLWKLHQAGLLTSPLSPFLLLRDSGTWLTK